MSRPAKYYPKLAPLLNRAAFTIEDAKKLGVPRQTLAYLTTQGKLERLAPGVYRATDFISDIHPAIEDLVAAAVTIHDSVVCLVSALSYYEMTDEIPRENWVAIPNTQYAPKRPFLRIVRMRNTVLGRTSVRIDHQVVHIFDRERCIIDAFRYLSKEIAIKALKEYLSKKPNLNRLNQYAKLLHVNLRPYILSLTT